MRPRPSRWLRPLGWLFAAVVGLRNALYDRGWVSTVKLSLPVVSVGNLTVGGTGKTPLVALLSQALAGAGWRPAVVSRGHGGLNARRRDGGPLVVSRGDGDGPRVTAGEAGDEPLLLASLLPALPVVVGRDRVAACRLAQDRLGADLIVLDDGFQHRRLHRDANLLTLDAGCELEKESLLPAGRRREPVRALRRAHVVVATRADRDDEFRRLVEAVHVLAPGMPVFRARHRPVGLRRLDGGGHPPVTLDDLRGLPVSGFAGIATPRVLERTLTGLGARVVHFNDLPDHHAYRPGEVEKLVESGRCAGARLAVTTAKDAVRLPAETDRAGIAALDIALDVEDLGGLLDRLRALCSLPTRGTAARTD